MVPQTKKGDTANDNRIRAKRLPEAYEERLKRRPTWICKKDQDAIPDPSRAPQGKVTWYNQELVEGGAVLPSTG